MKVCFGRARSAAVVVLLAALGAACSDDSGGSSPSDTTSPGASVVADSTDASATTGSDGSGTSVAPLPPPIVDQIAAAVDALETELGGPQRYFEINATAQLINLFVALNDGFGNGKRRFAKNAACCANAGFRFDRAGRWFAVDEQTGRALGTPRV